MVFWSVGAGGPAKCLRGGSPTPGSGFYWKIFQLSKRLRHHQPDDHHYRHDLVNVSNPDHGVAQGARHQIRDASRRDGFFESNAKHLAPWDENGRNRDEDPDKEHKGSQKPIWLGALKEAKNRMAFNPGGEQSKQKHCAAAGMTMSLSNRPMRSTKT